MGKDSPAGPVLWTQLPVWTLESVMKLDLKPSLKIKFIIKVNTEMISLALL